MKVFLIENNNRNSLLPISWRFIPDSAVSNAGKPFFIPDGENMVELSAGVAIRINRLGKTIGEKFGGRYYDAFAPVIKFTLPGLREILNNAGVSVDPSVSFDRALFVGSFKDKEELEFPIVLKIKRNGEETSVFNTSEVKETFEEVISRISRLNTVKMGDLVVVGLSDRINVKDGDVVQLFSGHEEVLKVKIR